MGARLDSRLASAVCGLLLGALACGKEPTLPMPVARVHIGPDKLQLTVGQSRQLSVTLWDANGSRLPERDVTWASDDPSKVTVSSAGLVTAVSLSDGVVIFATSEGVVGSTIVSSVIDLAGEWNFAEQGTWNDVPCENTGSYQFLQTSAGFRGSIAGVKTCGTWDYSNLPWPDSLENIELFGTFIRFRVSDCQIEGAITTNPGAELRGSVACESGYSATWHATRGGQPIASIEVRWDVATVPGASAQLMAVPRDALGHVLRRAMTWTGDNDAVARVNQTGLVTTVAPGAVQITAASEGQTGSATVTVDAATLRSVTVAFWSSCGLTAAGRAYCWGYGGYGELGLGVRPFLRAPDETQQSPRAVAGNHDFVQVDAGHLAPCGVTSASETYCWGDNSEGQLGDGVDSSRLAPTKVAGAELYASVAVGGWHSCGRTASGTALCWGYNSYGQLGTGGTVNSATPAAVSGSLQFRSISAGYFHTCGVAMDSTAYCWGDNWSGMLGDGSTTQRNAPVPVAGGHKFAVAIAGGHFSCGIAVDSSAYCWGRYGHRVPVAVAGGHAFGALAVGHGHACALTASGSAFCWGYNAFGQLGDGTIEDRLTPVPVSRSISFASIAATGWHTCASTAAGATWCWGLNEDGQLGAQTTGLCHYNGYDYRCSSVPVHVQGQVGATRTLTSVSAPSPHASSQRLPSPRAPALRRPGGNTAGVLISPRLH